MPLAAGSASSSVVQKKWTQNFGLPADLAIRLAVTPLKAKRTLHRREIFPKFGGEALKLLHAARFIFLKPLISALATRSRTTRRQSSLGRRNRTTVSCSLVVTARHVKFTKSATEPCLEVP